MAEIKSVLLVTSRFATLDFVHNTLTAPGRDYEVRTVASAEEAILALRRSSYNLLVSEQQLPGISGAEMAQKVKMMEPEVPIVVIAADAVQRQQVAAAEIESVYAVKQPLTESDLIDTVTMALRNAGAAGHDASPDVQRRVSMEEIPEADKAEAADTVVAEMRPEQEATEAQTPIRSADENRIKQTLAESSPRADQNKTSAQFRRELHTTELVGTNPTPDVEGPGNVSAAVRGRLELLHADTGANQVMLATMGGEVLHLVGGQQGNGLAQMATAVAANMAGSFDLAQILESSKPLAIHYQGGEERELLCANVGKNYLLAILFAAKGGRGRIGTAWIFTRRAVKDLGGLLADSMPDKAVDSVEEEERGSDSVSSGETTGMEMSEDAPSAANAKMEDLDRFWEEALAGTLPNEDASSAIGLEEARRLGLIPPDFDLDNR